MTPEALYWRQRELVRAGLLNLGDGRGPGSGVRTNAESVAMLLTALLATDSLAETGERTRKIAGLTPADAGRCPLTGARSFHGALTSLLSRGMARRVVAITVSRTAARAVIRYKDRESREQRESAFAGTGIAEPSLSVVATLTSSLWWKIADDVNALIAASEILAAEHEQPIATEPSSPDSNMDGEPE